MVDRLLAVLEGFGFPVYRQGSLTGDYPPAFFTFWNNDSDDDVFYNNKAEATLWDFSVNFYSNDPAQVESGLKAAIKALRDAGFLVSGKGHDVGSDEKTHTGRGVNVQIQERND